MSKMQGVGLTVWLLIKMPPGGTTQVMVSGAVAHPTANTKPDVTVSHHPAFQLSGSCQQHLRTMSEIVTMSVDEGEIKVMMIVMVTISVMNLKHVRCAQA